MKRPTTRLAAAHLAIVLFCVSLDQLSKYLIERLLREGNRVPLVGPLVITHARNTGAAFGLFRGSSTALAVVGLCLLLVIAAMWWFDPSSGKARWGFALIASGCIGNVVDRVVRGAVVDFIDVGFWPVFNVADACLVVGSLITLVAFVLDTRSTPESEEIGNHRIG